jgi:hypothetical protein
MGAAPHDRCVAGGVVERQLVAEEHRVIGDLAEGLAALFLVAEVQGAVGPVAEKLARQGAIPIGPEGHGPVLPRLAQGDQHAEPVALNRTPAAEASAARRGLAAERPPVVGELVEANAQRRTGWPPVVPAIDELPVGSARRERKAVALNEVVVLVAVVAEGVLDGDGARVAVDTEEERGGVAPDLLVVRVRGLERLLGAIVPEEVHRHLDGSLLRHAELLDDQRQLSGLLPRLIATDDGLSRGGAGTVPARPGQGDLQELLPQVEPAPLEATAHLHLLAALVLEHA